MRKGSLWSSASGIGHGRGAVQQQALTAHPFTKSFRGAVQRQALTAPPPLDEGHAPGHTAAKRRRRNAFVHSPGGHSERHKPAARHKPTTRHRVSRPGGPCRAWLSANHKGGRFTKEACAAYREAMQNPATRTEFERIGSLMRADALRNPARRRQAKRPNGHLDRKLRVAREAHTRAGKAWNPRAREAAKRKLQKASTCPGEVEWNRQLQELRDRKRQKKEARDTKVNKLASHGWRRTSVADSLFPSQAGTLYQEPSIHKRLNMWTWVDPVADRVMRRMFQAPRGLPGEPQLCWEGLHATISTGPNVRPPSREEQRQMRSQATGADVGIPEAGLTALSIPVMVAILTHQLRIFTGMQQRGRSTKIAECPRAVLLEQGFVLMGLETKGEDAQGQDCLWYHVSHCYFAQQNLRPTFLRLRLVRSGERGATFKPMFAVGHYRQRFWWQTLTEVASSVCTEAPATDTLSIRFLEVTEDPGGQRRCQEEVYGANLCGADRAWYRGMALSEIRAVGEQPDDNDNDDVATNAGDIPQEGMDLCDEDNENDSGEKTPAEAGIAAFLPKDNPNPGEAGMTAPPLDPPAAANLQLDPMAEERVEKVKRAVRGHREVLQGGPDGFAFEALFTHRKVGPKTPHGGYQATCYHHDAETAAGQSTRASLRCVKELPCEEEGDDARVLSLLREWVCSASAFSTRRDHMKSLVRAQSRQHLAAVQRQRQAVTAPKQALTAPKQALTAPKPTPTAPAQAPSADTHEISSQESSSSSSSSSSARDSPDLHCWVCGGDHATADCWYMRAATFASLQEGLRNNRVRGSDSVVLAAEHVQLRDVPGDGDCLFHALQLELVAKSRGQQQGLLRNDMPQGGERVRLADMVVGVCRLLQRSRGRPSLGILVGHTPAAIPARDASWREQPKEDMGGFLEVVFLTTALQAQNVSVLMLERRAEGFLVIAWSRAEVRDATRIVCAAWSGAHWQRARLRAQGWAALFTAWSSGDH